MKCPALLLTAAAICAACSGDAPTAATASSPPSAAATVITVTAGPVRQVTAEDVSAECAEAATPLWAFIQTHESADVAASSELQDEFMQLNVAPRQACSADDYVKLGQIQVLGWAGESERPSTP